MRDAVTTQLLAEFTDTHGLRSLSKAERFEAFVAYCVLSEYTYDGFAPDDFRIGGEGDGGVDCYAIVIGERLYRYPEELERYFADHRDVTVTVVMIQAKTYYKFERSVIADQRVRVEGLLDFGRRLRNAEAAEPLRRCLRIIRDNMDRLAPQGATLAVTYACTSKRANDELLEEAEHCAKALKGVGFFSNVDYTCLGRDDLRRGYERAQWSRTANLAFGHHYDLSGVDEVGFVRQGVVAATDLVHALSDANGYLDDGLFSENIRDYIPEAVVNEAIRATLRDERRRERFSVLNNGVTIVARAVRTSGDGQVNMRDFQVVDGCQTCHVLDESREHLDGVQVKVQLIESDDDDAVNDIVMATNSQTAIPKAYMENRRPLARRLEVRFRAAPPSRRIRLLRKPNRKSGATLLRERTVTFPQVLKAYAAMFVDKEPPTREYRDIQDRMDTWFAVDDREDAFLVAASALVRWEWLIHREKISPRFRPMAHHALAVVGILYGARPLKGKKADQEEKFRELSETVWSDSAWDRLMSSRVLPVFEQAADALGQESTTESRKFGELVVRTAWEWRKGGGRRPR